MHMLHWNTRIPGFHWFSIGFLENQNVSGRAVLADSTEILIEVYIIQKHYARAARGGAFLATTFRAKQHSGVILPADRGGADFLPTDVPKSRNP